MTLRTSLLLLAACINSGVVAARETPQKTQRNARSEAPSSPLEKGVSEWGIVAGYGWAHHIWGGRADRQLVLAGARLGKVLTGPVGPGLLRGHFEVSVELLPAVILFQEETTYAVSATLLFRHYFRTSSRLKPFISIGAGPLFSNMEVPPGTSRLNFTPQGGLGVVVFRDAAMAFLLEYRLHHISNAGTASPNPGINSSCLQVGLSLFR